MPDDDARRGIIGGRQVGLHPAVPRYLDVLFPRANGRSLGNGGAEYLFTESQPTDEHLYQLRVDHQTSAANSLFVRVTHDRAEVIRIPPNKPPIATVDEATRNTYVTGQYQHSFTQNTLNQLRVGLNRSVSLADNRRTIDIPPDLAWLPGEKFGYLTIQGLVTEMAGDFRLPRNDRLNNWQISDMLIATRGRHLLRLGGQMQYLQFDQDTTSQAGGIVTFNSLELFLTGRPSNVDFAVPGKIDPIRKYRQWLFAGFLQDDVRVTDRLSLNLGLRYEAVTVPTEVDGKISNLRSVTDAALTIGDPWHDNPSLKNFAPRVGVAWDPVGSGRTSVRAGFGIFHDQILPKYYFFSGSLNPPFTTRTSIVNPPFPNVIANFDTNAYIRAQLQTVNADLQTPYIMQFNASVQRALTDDLDVTAGYVGSRGRNLLRLGDANLAPETIVNGVKTYQPAAGRRNPNFTGVWQRMTDARVVLRFAPGLGEPPLLPRLAGAAVVHAVGIHRRCERDQLAGFQQQRAVRVRLVRPRTRSRPVGVSRAAQSHGQRQLGAALRREPHRCHGRAAAWMAAERDRHLAIGSSVHRRARVQSLGQPEHDGIFTA